MESLHLVASGVKGFKSISRLSDVNVVLLVLRPRGLDVTSAHVSNRYHQSLRNQLICEGTVVPTDGAKLMVLFLSILGLILLESLGRSSGRINIQPAQKGWSDEECVGRLSDAQVGSFLTKRKKINCGWFCDCVPFFGGIARYLSWVITMTFFVRRQYDIFPIG